MFSKRALKDGLKRVLPGGLQRVLRHLYLEYGGGYAVRSYAQEGEDLLLKALFENRQTGFYVDVGAHHPERFSNTRIFYESGWSGINVEPNPDSAKKFKFHRKRDINLCMGVGAEEGILEYYILDEPALNSFDHELTLERVSTDGYKVLTTINVPVRTLGDILHTWAPGRQIDFLNVDAEGMDLQVLKSNDWDNYRPRAILVEILGASLEEIAADEVYLFLNSMGYRILAKTSRTGLFGSVGSPAGEDSHCSPREDA